nr:hypothetical protein [Clostridia bacterium]
MKKTTSLILLLSMLAALVSCAAKAPNPSETTAADTAETTSAEETTAPPEYVAPDVDYEGADFTVSVFDGSYTGWILGSYCEFYTEEENGDPINDAIYQRNRKVEEELNVKISVSLPFTEMSSAVSTITPVILSGDDVFKFASVSGDSLPHLMGNGGMLTDLNDILTLDLDTSWWDQKSVEEFELFGTAYAVTGDLNFYNKGAPICNLFSKKLVEDLNLDNPYQLVYDGQWTIDNMQKMCEATAADINGDGKMTPEEDRWGMMAETPSISFFLLGTGQRLTERSDDEITVVLNSERTVNLVEKMVPFLRNKNVNMYQPDYSKQYTSVFTDLYLPKLSNDEALIYSNQILVALNLRNMESDFGILPLPKLDESQENYFNATNTWWHTFTIVPVTNGVLDM